MKKWMKWAIAFAMVLNVVLFVIDRNWQALLWLACCAVWVWIVEIQCKTIDDKDKKIVELWHLIRLRDYYIDRMQPSDPVRVAEGKQEAYLANCASLLNRCRYYREQNKRLHTLVKNLMDNNSNKGVKNYAKHTNRRTDKNRITPGIE